MRLSEQGAPLIPPGGSEDRRLKSRTSLLRAGVDYWVRTGPELAQALSKSRSQSEAYHFLGGGRRASVVQRAGLMGVDNNTSVSDTTGGVSVRIEEQDVGKRSRCRRTGRSKITRI